jgi:hypothetical protein
MTPLDVEALRQFTLLCGYTNGNVSRSEEALTGSFIQENEEEKRRTI